LAFNECVLFKLWEFLILDWTKKLLHDIFNLAI